MEPRSVERVSRVLATLSSVPVLLGVVVWCTCALGVPLMLLSVGDAWWTGLVFAAILGLGLAALIWIGTSVLGFLLALVLGGHWVRDKVEGYVDEG